MRRAGPALTALARSLTCVAGRVVVLFVVLGAPACALTADGHCEGVVGSDEEKKAQRVWRGTQLALAHKLASRLLPRRRIGVVLLGTIVASALTTPGRVGENGFAASAAEGRFRIVQLSGECIEVMQLPRGTVVVYMHELAALTWAVRFRSATAMVNNALLHLAGVLALARFSDWVGVAAPAAQVFNVVQHCDVSARLTTPVRAVALLAARSSAAAAARQQDALEVLLERERAALEALVTEEGLCVQAGGDRRARVALASGDVRVALPRSANPRLRLLPREPLVLYLDVERKQLRVARDARPSAPVVQLLCTLPQSDAAVAQLLAAAADREAAPASFPAPPAPGSLPRWLARRGLGEDEATQAANKAEAALAVRDAASLLARAEFFAAHPMMQLQAAEERWRAVARAAGQRARREPGAHWEEVAANAKQRAQRAADEINAAETAEMEWAAEMRAFVEALQAVGAPEPLRGLPPPPQPTVEALRAASPPSAHELESVGVDTRATLVYRFASRPGLSAEQRWLATHAFPLWAGMPRKEGGDDGTRLSVRLPGALGMTSCALGAVPTSDYGAAAVGAALAGLACGATGTPPVPVRLLRAILGDTMVDAVRALPPLHAHFRDVEDPLHWAARDALTGICDCARRCATALRSPDELDAWRERLHVWVDDLRSLAQADYDGTLVPAPLAATREPWSNQRTGAEGFKYVSFPGGYYEAVLAEALGVKSLSCTALTAQMAGRVADAMLLICGRGRDQPKLLNFTLDQYPPELLPRLPVSVGLRGGGGDTLELQEMRETLVRPLARVVAAIADASDLHGWRMSQAVQGALVAHARLLAAELRAAAVGAGALAEARDWAAGMDGAAGGAGPGPGRVFGRRRQPEMAAQRERDQEREEWRRQDEERAQQRSLPPLSFPPPPPPPPRAGAESVAKRLRAASPDAGAEAGGADEAAAAGGAGGLAHDDYRVRDELAGLPPLSSIPIASISAPAAPPPAPAATWEPGDLMRALGLDP